VKTLIVGASSWVTRSMESVLLEKLNIQKDNIHLFGSKYRKKFFCNGREYEVSEWSESNWFHAELFLPFAFATVDKYEELGKRKYLELNQQLIQRSMKYIEIYRPTNCLLISSGITSQNSNIVARSEAYMAYAKMKSIEEESLQNISRKVGTQLLICRLYSASGRHITEPAKYAFGDLIIQALSNGRIALRDNFEVYRRYVDMAQMLTICAKALIYRQETFLESGGELIELHDLARHIARLLDVEYVENKALSNKKDFYFGNSNRFEELASLNDVSLMSIESQIKETIVGVKEFLLGKPIGI